MGQEESRSPPSEPIGWSLRHAVCSVSLLLFLVRSVSACLFFIMPRKGKKTKHTAGELAAKIAAHKPRGKADGGMMGECEGRAASMRCARVVAAATGCSLLADRAYICHVSL